jgi:GNAT superfamily N-acetyltransferase
MIRPTVPADTDVLVAIAQGTGVFKPLEIDTLREVIRDYHDKSDEGSHHTAITYEKDARPIGFAYYAPTPMTVGTWYLYWIFVDKNIQARGLGAALMRHVEEDLHKRGGRVLLIETSGLPHYDLTRKFYLKIGYKQVAVLPDFYADGDDMVVFWKRIAAGT